MDIKKTVEAQANQIDTIIHAACNKKNITGELANDFKSYVYLKLLEDDGRRIRDFKGDDGASWSGYLTVIIARLAIDFIKKQWGRWENSTTAKICGEPVMRFEALLYRDRFSFHQASQIMLDNIEFNKLYRLSPIEFQKIKKNVPLKIQSLIKNLAGPTIYKEKVFDNLLDKHLPKSSILEFKASIKESTQINLSVELMEEWEMSLQGRIPAIRPVYIAPTLSSDPDEQDQNYIEKLPDKQLTDPMEVIMDKEMELSLDPFIEKLIDNINDEDWMIVSLYFIENMRISEIAKMMGPYSKNKTSKNNQTHQNKNWKYISKRISLFTKNIEHQVSLMSVKKEDYHRTTQLCLQIISKKISEKQRSPSSN